MTMFGDSHLEHQRCPSLQSPRVPGLLNARRSTLPRDTPPRRPAWLPRHSRTLPLPGPTSLLLTDLRGEGRGQQAFPFVGQEGQGLQASLSQRNIHRHSDCLTLELWAPNPVPSPCVALPMWFSNWCLSFESGTTAATCKAASLSRLLHPPSWTGLAIAVFAQRTASRAATSSTFSKRSLPTSRNEMLSRSELERQLDFTH